MNMKAILIHNFGGVEELKWGEWPMPQPKAGEVRIQIKAISVNPVDTKMRNGAMGAELPMVLGRDVAGVVDAVGEGSEAFSPGEEVFAVLSGPRSNGAYAQYVTVPETFVARKPRGLDHAQAAAMGVAGITAYETVFGKGKITSGEAVLVAGGAGGVGSFAIPMLRHLGAGPILATCGSDESAAYLTNTLGIAPEHLIRYRGASVEDMAARARELTGGRGVAAALDYVGGEMKKLCFASLDFDGRVVSIVEEYSQDFELDIWRPAVSPLWNKSGSFHFVAMSARARFGGPQDWGFYEEVLAGLSALVEAGHVPPPQVTDLGVLDEASIREAHRILESGQGRGKLVLRVE